MQQEQEPQEQECQHRPDDLPEPGDRCKYCGKELTWIGPGPYDWEEAEGAEEPVVIDGVMHVWVTVLAKVRISDYTLAYGVTEAEAIKEAPDHVREHVLYGVQETHKHHDVYQSFELSETESD